MKIKQTTEDGKGNIISEEDIEIQDSQPSELEIRLAALEAKTGVTEQDKMNAKLKLKGEKL